MKIKLDTTQKRITLEENINLGEFFKALEEILPNGMWRDYVIETGTVWNWTNPIIWNTPYYEVPCGTGSPTITQPWITCGSTTTGSADYTTTYKEIPGTYCIDINLNG